MGDLTNIEWCDSTFNPWIGCTRVSPACDDCYAARSTPARAIGVAWGPHEQRHRTGADNWRQVEAWDRAHAEFFVQHGRRRRVFCASLADWVDNAVPIGWFVDLLELIRTTPHLDWLLLTKRIGNVVSRLHQAQQYICEAWPAIDAQPLSHWITDWVEGAEPPANVWIGATVVNQPELCRDVGKLLEVPARIHFLSIEPMLGAISFVGLFASSERINDGTNALEALDWIICGGESGPRARPMQPDWARSLRDQCAAAGVPFLFKQWGEWIGADQDECPNGPPASRWMWGDGTPFSYGGAKGALPLLCRAGKKVTGRLLDGVEHNAFPSIGGAA